MGTHVASADPPTSTPGGPTPRPIPSGRLYELGELVGLCTLAIAQPILAVFANDPETFVFYRAQRSTIVAFVVLVLVAPPVALWFMDLAAGLISRDARRWVHIALVGALVGLFSIQLMAEVTDLPNTVVYGAGLLIMVAAAYARWNVAAVRLWLLFLVPLAPVVGIWFVVSSPVSEVVDTDSTPSNAADVTVAHPVPIVMVQLDELPTVSLLDASGRIDAEVFPNFARLADDSTWFRNHTTVAGTTNRALPAILSGRYPTLAERLPAAQAHPQNLFSLLGSTYEMHATEQISLMCPSNLCTPETVSKPWLDGLRALLGDASDVWRQNIALEAHRTTGVDTSGVNAPEVAFPSGYQFPVDDVTTEEQPDVFRTFIESLDESDRPRLDYLHVGLPHGRWRFLPSGARHDYDVPELPSDTDLTALDQVPPVFWQPHLLQLQHTDRLVGELLDRLDELGVYDDALVVITADHGVSLTQWPTGRFTSRATYPEMAWTPLFVKGPQQRDGLVDDRPVQIIDIMPTIADMLGVTIPWEIDGVSALSKSPPQSNGELRFIADSTAIDEPTDGEYLIFDREAGFERVLAGGIVSEGGDALSRVFGSGPFDGVVGTRVADMTISDTADATVQLDPPGAVLVVDPDSDVIPIGLTGRISPALAGEIAIAVNGRIGAIASRIGLDRGTLVTGVVPEEYVTAGDNEIELYVVDGEPGAEVLHPIPISP